MILWMPVMMVINNYSSSAMEKSSDDESVSIFDTGSSCDDASSL